MPQDRTISLIASLYVVSFAVAAIAILLEGTWTRWRNQARGTSRKPLSSRELPRWLIWPLVALFFLALFYLQGHPLARARPLGARPPVPLPWWVPILPAIFVVAYVFILLRRQRTAGTGKTSGMQRVFMTIVLIAGALAVAFAVASEWAGRGRAADALILRFAVMLPILLFVVLGGMVLVLWLRHRDPIASHALSRAGEGDVDGAIRDLLDEAALKGQTAHRANALGTLYLEKEEYREALGRFDEAERLGYDRTVCRANRANALRKMGRVAEAAALFEELCAEKPDEPVLAGMYCLALADLGRMEEAREQLRRAELPPSTVVLGRAHREGVEKMLRECRERVGEQIPKPEGVDEF